MKTSNQSSAESRKSRVFRSLGFFGSRPSALGLRPSERGVALIITLILLAVTLVMALAFLAISRRESGSVTTAGETATARLAADAALANAEAEAAAGILSTTNPANFGLLVSTNYINPAGFVSGIANPTNVNYDYLAGGGALNQAQQLQNLENLYYSPRPPVFIPNPPGNYARPSAGYDFRFYLDLNRNGKPDANGIVADVDNTGVTNGNFSFEVGDPEWIGVLEHPDQPYGPDNLFIARYAFIALPVGNALDLNYIYNQALIPPLRYSGNPMSTGPDAYFRNQGVGSWEINLPAFLADLNTNEWTTYNYLEPLNPPFPNSGNSFDDARALLAYRYNNNYNTLATVQSLYGNIGATAFRNDGIDGYSDGPLQTTYDTNADFVFNPDRDFFPFYPWAGADSTNHFFTPSDLFNPAKSSPAFTNRLALATRGNGTANPSTYDRYTFYRLLQQLGTESSPESGRMNLNYDNLDGYGNVIPGAETNFIPWTNSVKFFTGAADRMLRAYTIQWRNGDPTNFAITYYGVTNLMGLDGQMANGQYPAFDITDIPVYVNGRFVYTPAINRILQLAANIYDATKSNRTNGSPDYPDVFRPLFSRDNGGTGTNIYITGYTNLMNNGVPNTVSGPGDPQLSQPFDVAYISGLSGVIANVPDNIYGVPWIIGAKKGFPNFNEISVENNLAVTRRLQLTRTTNSYVPVITGTNQMYTMSLNSSIGIELWNSYVSNYPGTIQIAVNENASTMITNNDQGLHEWVLQPLLTNALYSINPWPGSGVGWRSSGSPNAASFIPITFTGPTLNNSVYRSSHYAGGADLVSTNNLPSPVPWEPTSTDGNGFYFPQFGVLLTNRLQVFMLAHDSSGYHVIDYVHFDGPDGRFNVNSNLADNDALNNYVGVWDTNYPAGSAPLTGVTYGILNQIRISKSGAPDQNLDGLWQADPEAVPLGGTIAQQQAFFQAFFLPGNTTTTPVAATNLELSVEAPYSPTRYISQYATWQANDPFVHYLASDIDEAPPNNTSIPQPGLNHYNFPITNGLTSLNLGQLNDRYTPWGGNSKLAAEGQALQSDPNAYNSAERDPLAYSSDNWDFPTNKMPTTGSLGRVHRGTPWQTVYLKSTNILATAGIGTWAAWTGDTQTSFNQYFDAANSAPAQDRLLFDLFTTAFSDNATRGQLSVNVAAGDPDPAAGLAAWSALFSGVVVLTNNPFAGTVTNMIIQPAGIYAATNPPPLAQIVGGINSGRKNFVNADGLRGSFEHVGDILSVPQLTDKSPFINTTTPDANGNRIYPNDEVMEWLPQQVMSLLRVGTPSYVIYSYGQALKPAPTPNGVYTANGLLITNYQIVTEAATRTVVRFDSTVTNILGTNSVINNRAVIEKYNILPPD